MKAIYPLLALLSLCFNACQSSVDEASIRQEVLVHGKTIRDAFATSDLAQIKALHHPDVTKALAYDDIKHNREEVMEGIAGALQNFTLEFVENEVESIFIQDDLAIEQSRFAIKGTPKNGGDSFTFSGRTMVTYIRYADSPTGWATIREIIQPATE